MPTLKQVYQEHLDQEFPPKLVFCYENDQLRSLETNQLHHFDRTHYIKCMSIHTPYYNGVNLPVVKLKGEV